MWRSIRTALIVILVVGGGLSVLAAMIAERPELAMTLGVIGIVSLILVVLFFNWLLGIRRHVRRHLHIKVVNAASLEHRGDLRQQPDVLRALEALLNEEARHSQRIGIAQTHGRLLPTVQSNTETLPLKWNSSAISTSDWDELPQNAVYLLQVEVSPFVAAAFPDDENFDGSRRPRATDNSILVQIIAADMAVCRQARDMILKLAPQASALKGQPLVLRRGQPSEGSRVEFITVQPVDRSQIILPDFIFQAETDAAWSGTA